MNAVADVFPVARVAWCRKVRKTGQFFSVMATPPTPQEIRLREDVALIQQVGRRDERAFGELYDRFSPGMYSVALRMLGDAKDAEDVLQEAFHQIWNRAGVFDASRSSAFSWATMILWRKSVDKLRIRQRLNRTVDRAIDLQHFADADETSAAIPAQTERHGEVRKALLSIPSEQKEALHLAFFGGFTQQQIADRLREPLGTIKARIRRGLLRLKDLLREET